MSDVAVSCTPYWERNKEPGSLFAACCYIRSNDLSHDVNVSWKNKRFSKRLNLKEPSFFTSTTRGGTATLDNVDVKMLLQIKKI